ncbi:MAG: pgi, partial [Firmicutes bacterium]|nr:pgi [Bacillota bacterium]
MLRFDYNNALSFFRKEELEFITPQVTAAHVQLHQKSGAGSDYLGWVDLPAKYDKAEFARIRKAAAKIRKDSDVLVVIGIGGSYLGARAAIELLTHSFNNTLTKRQRKGPQII